MLTLREAKQRAYVLNGQIYKTKAGDYRVTLNEWTRQEREAMSYFTDDIEDAVLTLGSLRMHVTRSKAT